MAEGLDVLSSGVPPEPVSNRSTRAEMSIRIDLAPMLCREGYWRLTVLNCLSHSGSLHIQFFPTSLSVRFNLFVCRSESSSRST